MEYIEILKSVYSKTKWLQLTV